MRVASDPPTSPRILRLAGVVIGAATVGGGATSMIGLAQEFVSAPTCLGVTSRLASHPIRVWGSPSSTVIERERIRLIGDPSERDIAELLATTIGTLETYYTGTDETLERFLSAHALTPAPRTEVVQDQSTRHFVESSGASGALPTDSGEPVFFQVRRWYLSDERAVNRIAGVVDSPQFALIAIGTCEFQGVGWFRLPYDAQLGWLTRAAWGGRTRFVRTTLELTPESMVEVAQVALNVEFADGFRCPMSVLFFRPSGSHPWTLARLTLSNDCDDLHAPPQF